MHILMAAFGVGLYLSLTNRTKAARAFERELGIAIAIGAVGGLLFLCYALNNLASVDYGH